MKIKSLIVSFLLVVVGFANVWDNIFSQMQAKTPIILKTSINFKFPLSYEGIDFEGEFDYNHDLKIVRVSIKKSILIISVAVLELQVDLSTYLVTLKQMMGCSRYKLQLMEEPLQQRAQSAVKQALDQPISKVFLLNILFQYKGKEKNYKKYIFKPDLLAKHDSTHEMQENLLVLVNEQGNIKHVYDKEGKGRKKIPFSLASNIQEKFECQEKVQTVTRNDLSKVILGLIEKQKDDDV